MQKLQHQSSATVETNIIIIRSGYRVYSGQEKHIRKLAITST